MILNTRGAVRILGPDGRPERIPNAKMDSVWGMVKAHAVLIPGQLLRKGLAMRVRRGPLAGVEGLIRAKNSNRLVDSISLLSRSVATEVDIANLEPIAGGSYTRARASQ